MKYSFCYIIEKIIKEDGTLQGEPTDNANYISFSHGPWRDTLEEVEKDKKMFNEDKMGFLKMVTGMKE